MVGVEESVENNITVWDWSREHKQINTKVHLTQSLNFIVFTPFQKALIIISGGSTGELKFFLITPKINLSGQSHTNLLTSLVSIS